MSASLKKIDWSKPVESCYGGKARRVAELYSSEQGLRNVVTYFDNSQQKEITVLCDDCGNINACLGFFRNVAPPKRQVVRWVNIYSDGAISTHHNRVDADCFAIGGRVACVEVKIEYTEGQGL